MPQSLSKVYVHPTFSTKNRHPYIDNGIKERLWEYLGGICRGLECYPLQVGGYNDHVHIISLLSRKISQARFVEEVKKQSSKWIKTVDNQYSDFYWQDGYGIFSVNPTQVETVVAYIKNQEEHHRGEAFQEEMVGFLKKYHVLYDERYLWD
jgi:REP element-mobilizing transposase RayT